MKKTIQQSTKQLASIILPSQSAFSKQSTSKTTLKQQIRFSSSLLNQQKKQEFQQLNEGDLSENSTNSSAVGYLYRECDRERELAPFSNMTSKTLSTIDFNQLPQHHGNYFKPTKPNKSYAQVEINPIQQQQSEQIDHHGLRLSVQFTNSNDEQSQPPPPPLIIDRVEAIKKAQEAIDANIDLSIVYSYSKMNATSLSVSTLIEFVENTSINSLVVSSGWLIEELRIRLAQQVQLLDELPHGLNLMPSIRIVRDWYLTSFKQLYQMKSKPRNRSEEIEFTNIIRTIYDRHNPTMVSVAGGVSELKEELKKTMSGYIEYSNYSSLRDHLDSFYINRIGIRTLLEHHLSLHDLVENPSCNLSKMICKHTNPIRVAKRAIQDAQDWSFAHYGKFPQVTVTTKTDSSEDDLSFPYVPFHLQFQLFELLINSMRAIVETTTVEQLPPIEILMSSSSDEVTIRISDQGKGIPRKDMPQLFSYLYTTATVRKELVNQDGKQASVAGLGFGLPQIRLYSKYWGGDFKLNSVSGYGTDAYLYFTK